jgi:hypothetical protein
MRQFPLVFLRQRGEFKHHCIYITADASPGGTDKSYTPQRPGGFVMPRTGSSQSAYSF